MLRYVGLAGSGFWGRLPLLIEVQELGGLLMPRKKCLVAREEGCGDGSMLWSCQFRNHHDHSSRVPTVHRHDRVLPDIQGTGTAWLSGFLRCLQRDLPQQVVSPVPFNAVISACGKCFVWQQVLVLLQDCI